MRLVWDIETSPMVARVWQRYDVTVSWDQIVKHTEIICWSAKDIDTGKWYYDSQHLHGGKGDKQVVKSLHRLMSQATVMIAHNGTRFDTPVAYSRMAYHGMTKPAPCKQIDTLRLARSQFRFPGNRLDELADYLGVQRKNKMSQTDWNRCAEGDVKAFAKMLRYNRKDVTVLEAVYNRLLSWVKQPLAAEGHTCPSCGSDHVHRRGKVLTKTCTYQGYQCQDCGSWSQGPLVIDRRKGLRSA